MGGGEDLGGPQDPLKPLNYFYPYLLRLILSNRAVDGSIMKEIDDTVLPKTESERLWRSIHALEKLVESHMLRLANLETQRTPQDQNDDPEWFA